MRKKRFDVIVIGAGSGLIIASEAVSRGLKVAIVEKGPFGGTCLNRGCIPSKMLIHSADLMDSIRNSHVFGINAVVKNVDWKKIQKRVWSTINQDAREIENANRAQKNVKIYKTTAEFVGKKILKVGNELITANKIFICAGTRPIIPSVEGLNTVKYVTSDEALKLKKQPKSMIILGGGYIGAELGHFFSSLGTNVTIVDRGEMLVKNEDKEIAKAFTKIISKKYNVMLNTAIAGVYQKGKNVVMEVEQNKKKKKITADVLFVATGRRPNTDILHVEKTGVKINKFEYINVNKFMESNVSGIWAIGDIAGVYFFKHSANLEATYCAHNAFNPKKVKVDYAAMPHAIFTSPQIAGVGLTEEQVIEKKIQYLVGKYQYYDTGMGKTIEDKDGFVKVLVHKKTKKILGCHIIGHEASTLIHEVVVAMKAGLGVEGITKAVHVHPALPEVVQRAFNSVED